MRKRSMIKRLRTLQETKTSQGFSEEKVTARQFYHPLVKFVTKMEENKITEARLRRLANNKHTRIVAPKPKIAMRYVWIIY